MNFLSKLIKDLPDTDRLISEAYFCPSGFSINSHSDMCGIAGFISLSPVPDGDIRLKKMSDAIAHRGPNGETYYISPSSIAYFGHRRLCVIDISEAAGQPLPYADRYTIMHNGEIYNYIELRTDLQKKGYTFKSQSDTEVIVAAYTHYGTECLQYLDGMFAFIIWDEKDKVLFMARDRFGEKPLFFHYDDQHHILLFASEIKALWAGGVTKKINEPFLLQFLSLGYKNEVENSNTYYNNINQLPPAHYAIYSPNHRTGIEISSYWDLDKEYHLDIPLNDATEKLKELLTESVKKRLRSDVPVGVNVSGGLDSSTLLSIISRPPGKKQPCFTVFFPEFKNEKEYVELLRGQFDNSHYYITPTADEFIADFEKLVYHQEQPFSSASVYAQYKLFALAKEQNITVLIDGQGADEIFGGYNKYIFPFLQEIKKNKGSTRFLQQKEALVNNQHQVRWSFREKIAATFPYLTSKYLSRKERFFLQDQSLFTKEFTKNAISGNPIYKPVVEKLNDVLYYNVRQNGLPELLRYADRNAMAHGREARLPFLDHKLVEFVFSLPAEYKINLGWMKWILRKSVEPDLPGAIVWRKTKVAFEPPQKQWMESNQVQEMIQQNKHKLVEAKILQPAILLKKIQPHDAYAAENFDWRYLVAGSLL